MISYKYRIYPTHFQKFIIDRDLELVRFVWNWALDKTIKNYEEQKEEKKKKKIDWYALSRELTQLKKDKKELQLAYSGCLTLTIRRLKLAYAAFFCRVRNGEKPGFPKFKVYGRSSSMTRQFQCDQKKLFMYKNLSKEEKLLITSTGELIDYKGSNLLNQYFYFSKNIGWLKMREHRKAEGRIKEITISRDNHKYFVEFATEYTAPAIEIKKEKKVEIELREGILYEAKTLKQQWTQKMPIFYLYFEKKIAKINRRMEKVKYLKYDDPLKMKIRRALHKVYDKQNNVRKEFIRNEVVKLTKQFNSFVISKFNVAKKVEKNLSSTENKEILDTHYHQFLTFLKWRCEKLGLKYIEKAES